MLHVSHESEAARLRLERAAAIADKYGDDDDTSCAAAAADATLIGAAFDPEWLLASDTFLPRDARAIREHWVPRYIGIVSHSGSSPESLEPTAGWHAYGAPRMTASGLVLPQWSDEPRLAFVDGWGSGNNKLFGTYLVTHYRKADFISYVAVRKITPSSDFAENPDGTSNVIFEALERNVHWVPAAVGSIDLSDTDNGGLGLFVLFNDNGVFQSKMVTAKTIEQWRQQMAMVSVDATATAADSPSSDYNPMEQARVAQERYWQVALAVKNAAKSDHRFHKYTQSIAQLKSIWNQEGSVPAEDSLIYSPDYRGNRNNIATNRGSRKTVVDGITRM